MTNFTSDWVTSNAPAWERHVVPALAGRARARWLEIGSYEGRSALWTLDHVLTGAGSTITCVDPWDSVWLRRGQVEERFDENTRSREGVVKHKGRSEDVLPTLPARSYDGVYVDGSHTLEDAYRDARLSLPLLLPGAFVIFDDYEGDVPDPWRGSQAASRPPRPREYGVHEAADRFVAELGERITVLHAEWQLIARLSG